MSQARLPLLNTSAPKIGLRDGQQVVDRSQCPTTRPCRQFSCPHHLWVEDERPGRPHGGRRPPSRVVARSESCALDVADQGEHTTEEIAQHLNVTPERVLQIEDRALAKLAAVRVVLDHLEAVLPRMPAGARVRIIMPEQLNANAVAIVTIVDVDGTSWRRAQEGGGVFVRRKAK